jgi:hypothetical protein
VVYDREKLLDCGGFSFWSSLPLEHSGEDVLAQMRVMAKYGRSGVLPCGVYHEELPTTIRVRDADAPYVLPGDAAG